MKDVPPCPACGAWWLPGAEQCPVHRPSAVPAPRVYPEPEPFTARWFEKHNPLTRLLILGPVR